MKKNTKILAASLLSMSLGLGGALIVNNVSTASTSADVGENYTLTLDESNSPSTLTENYQTAVNANIGFPTFNYGLAKKVEGAHVALAPRGKILNFSPSSANEYGRITSMKSMTVTFAGGDLALQTSVSNNGTWLGDAVALTSGEEVNLSTTNPYYFMLSAGDSAVTVESIVIKYSCSADTGYQIDELGTKFTAKDSDGIVWQLDRNGINVTVKTLNKESNDNYSGTIGIDGINVTLTLAGGAAVYTGTLSSDAQKITFASASGPYAAAVPHVDFSRVYNVEDFESYSATGNGYDQSHTINQTSGLRSNYMADYYASGSSMWGVTDWQKMGSSDYLSLYTAGGVGNSKTGVFKANGSGMRFVTSRSYFGIPSAIGKGSYFSFWAHGAMNSSGGASSYTPTLKIRLYSTSTVTKSNLTASTATEFTIPASSDWTHYEIPLDATKTYYGYMVYLKSASDNCYVPIDNVEIYTANPYAVYEAPAAPNYKQTLTVLGSAPFKESIASALGQTEMTILLGLGSNGYAMGYVWGQELNPSNYDIDEDGNVSMDADLSYESAMGTVTITKVTGTLSADKKSIENVEFTGSLINNMIDGNGSITLTEKPTTDSLDGTTDDMKANYQRWYLPSSGWTKTSNSDDLTPTTEQVMEGTGAMKIRGWADGAYRITPKTEFAEKTAVAGITFWIYNSTGKSIDLRIYCYEGQGYTNNYQAYGKTIAAGSGWTYVQVGTTVKWVKNAETGVTEKVPVDGIWSWAIFMQASSSTGPIIDYLETY